MKLRLQNDDYLFGGFDDGETNHSDQILKYDVDQQRWNELKVKLPHPTDNFPIFVTTNERYIVMLLYENDGYIVYYLDLNKGNLTEFEKSEYKPPFNWVERAVMTGNCGEDRVVVNGYLRGVLGEDLLNLVPNEIFEMVLEWYRVRGYVHFFQPDESDGWNSYKHSMVNIMHIIPNYHD